MQIGELSPRVADGRETRRRCRRRDVREHLFQVGPVVLAIGGIVQDAVDVVEDVVFRNQLTDGITIQCKDVIGDVVEAPVTPIIDILSGGTEVQPPSNVSSFS